MNEAVRAEIRRKKTFLKLYYYFSGVVYVAIIVGMVLLLALFVRAFLLGTFFVSSSSMTPTLLEGDRILVNKISYGITVPGVEEPFFERAPSPGDIVVFYRDPAKPRLTRQIWQTPEEQASFESTHYVKRIVASPGSYVEVKDGVTWVDDKAVALGKIGFWEEQSELKERVPNIARIKLGKAQYFVLGDNGSNSQDSRYFGPIDFQDIKGKVFMILWSEGREEGSSQAVRWKRLGKTIK